MIRYNRFCNVTRKLEHLSNSYADFDVTYKRATVVIHHIGKLYIIPDVPEHIDETIAT